MGREDFELQRSYGRWAVSFVKGLGLTAVGVAAILVVVKTPDAGVTKDGWLYVTLGPAGARLAMSGFAVALLLAGVVWAVLAWRGLMRSRAALVAHRSR